MLGRRVGGLDDEDVPAPGVPVDADEDLPVGELPDGRAVRRLPDDLPDLSGERAIGAAREEEERPPSEGVVHGSGVVGQRDGHVRRTA